MSIPTRTSNDPNAAADINSLQTQITSLTNTVATSTAAIYATLANYGQSVTVDGVAKSLYFKTITGTTDADGQTDVLHGLTRSKILYVKSSVNSVNDNASYFLEDVAYRYTALNNTYVILFNVDVQFQSQPYKITIGYHS